MPTFCMHAGLSRVFLSLGDGEVALECPDERMAAGIQELYLLGRSVVLDAHLRAEVAARGQNLVYRVDEELYDNHMVHIGMGPLSAHGMPAKADGPWPCACGACCQCLGAFERALEACSY